MIVIDRRARRGSSWPRRVTAGLCAVAMATQLACHTYLPAQDVVPVSGKKVAVVLNDRGRLLVGDRLGESVQQIEGRLLSSTDSVVTLSVTRTVMLQGSSAVWAGENVAIPREGVRSFRLREFSRGRTAALSVALVAGIALLGGLLTLVAGGGGRPGGDGGCTSNCPQQ
jgi:hypothetical protein